MKSIINALKPTFLLAALLLAPLAALPAADTPPTTTKPNIVFIFADDWGWGDLSCHGHAWLKTPNIDRLASEGMDFRQFNGGTGWPKAGLHATAANTVAFIQANKDRPFFVNVWLHESHTPHVPTPESMAKWKHLDEQKQVYSAVITDGDNAVGLILDALKREGLADNTIVMFASDNGPEWTHADKQHKKMGAGYGSWASIGQTGGLRGKKRSLYEGGVRVPFIVRWPGHTPAGVTDTTTVFTAVDLLPTLCAAAAVKLPADYQGDGENLLPALQGKAITRTHPIFWEWRGPKPEPDWWPCFAVRDGDWKLLMTGDAKRVELHNLKTDRAKEAGKDVSKAYPEIVARLTKMTLDWKVTLPTKVDANCVSPKRGAD